MKTTLQDEFCRRMASAVKALPKCPRCGKRLIASTMPHTCKKDPAA